MLPESGSSLTSLIKGINLNKIFGTANKTLGFVKQAIPIYKQVKPMFGNTKTFLNMYGAVKSDNEITEDIQISPLKNKAKSINNERKTKIDDSLTFFQ